MEYKKKGMFDAVDGCLVQFTDLATTLVARGRGRELDRRSFSALEGEAISAHQHIARLLELELAFTLSIGEAEGKPVSGAVSVAVAYAPHRRRIPLERYAGPLVEVRVHQYRPEQQ